MKSGAKINKAFCNHQANGIRLTFQNGNAISTIWGRGSYSDNHNYDSGDVTKDFTQPIESGSSTVEIMILQAPESLVKKIYKHQKGNIDSGVIGWATITDWLWIINQLAKPRKENNG